MGSEAENDESDSEWSGINNEDDENEDEAEDDSREALLKSKRTLLWLCQEGQIRLARLRLELLSESSQTDTSRGAQQLRKEIFQVGRDKNYAIHEILMGGTSDQNAYATTLSILEISRNYPLDQQKMLSSTPPSHGRTPLHWAAWGNAKLEILERLVRGNPEALLMRDKKRQGERTPLEILKHYFSGRDNSPAVETDIRIHYLERMTTSWISHRVRLAMSLCANRHFGATREDRPLVPFDKGDRKVANIKPKPWFLLSVIGYLLQREMNPLALRIISYLGGNAKITSTKRRKPQSNKKKRQHCMT